MENGNKDKDDFWDLDKLIPKKKATLSPFMTTEPTHKYEAAVPQEIEICGGDDLNIADKREDGERKLDFSKVAGVETSEDETYYPNNNGLIYRVTVKKSIDKYDFYDNFRKAALVYYDYKTDKCDFEPYYSFMPQYTQLTKEQKNYYFYWRSMVRRGKFIKTDYSYLYLYVYEILNLPDKISGEEGVKILTTLWHQYKKALPRINLYFTIWLEDYCFVHGLECPVEELGDLVFEAISTSNIKEFYLTDISKTEKQCVSSMLAFLSDYDWRKGKFVGGNSAETKTTEQGSKPSNPFNNPEMYKRHMEGAMGLLLSRVWSQCVKSVSEGKREVLIRNAFPGSLCTHTVKSRLEIEYYPVSQAEELRSGITAAVRYTENKLRAVIGVKSRLAVKGLPDEYKAILDRYFESLFEKERKFREKQNTPEYYKLYDAPREKLSFEGADEIERLSWQTTNRLVEDSEESMSDSNYTFEDSQSNSIVEAESVEEDTDISNNLGESTTEESNTDIDTYGLNINEIQYINYVLTGNSNESVAELLNSTPEDSVVERINEAFSDGFGDIILENDGEHYILLEDYTEEIGEWLNKILK